MVPLRSLSVIALCLVSLVTGGTAARVGWLLGQPRSAVVLLGIMLLVVAVLWTTARAGPGTTPYW